jgi:hypothetical protein
MKRLFLTFILATSSLNAWAGAVDGSWNMKKDAADQLSRAMSISGISFRSLISTSEGVAYESGWWTESPGTNGRTSVIVRYGDNNPPETIEYKLTGPDTVEVWMSGAANRWGTMTRSSCDLSLQYRPWADPVPAGCAWLHIKGWGYSALDGECMFNEEWEANPPPPGEMECLIMAPEGMVR